MAKYQAGQRWSYRTREQDVDSTLVIGKVQDDMSMGPVVHVMVNGIDNANSPESIDIGHMPFAEKAIDSSVLELIEDGVPIDPVFEDGIATWQEQKGGVFDLTVSEALEAMLSVIPPQTDDPFDEIVTEMRSLQSEELVEELYRQLFSLDHWFFLCEPDNPDAPVQWVFPEGMNPTPALLAFTSQQRAISAAAELGIYPEGSSVSIMPASVKESVNWITGPDCENEWLCFNLTQENFPLYCDEAQMLFENS